MSVNEPLMVPCPECSPTEPVRLERIHRRRVRCTECGAYFDIPPEGSKIEVRLQVSRQGQTSHEKAMLRDDELLYVGEERVFNTGEGVAGVEVTALELADGRRVEESKVGLLACIWARAIDEVTIRVTLQKGWRSKSHRIDVHGLYEFSVGTEERLGGLHFRVKALRTRDGLTLKRYGNVAAAKDLRTVYAEEPRTGRHRAHYDNSERTRRTGTTSKRSAASLWQSSGTAERSSRKWTTGDRHKRS